MRPFLRNQPLPTTAQSLRFRELRLALASLQGPALLQCLAELGTLARQLGELAAARDHFAEALALALELNDMRNWSANLVRLGVVLHFRSELAPAVDCFEQVLEAENHGYHDFALQHLGKLYEAIR